MAKLYFYNATMNSGKTLDLARAVYNYNERGMETIVFQPVVASRGESNQIVSRTGIITECVPVQNSTNLLTYITNQSAVFVDEAQFLTVEQVEQLYQIAHEYNIPVLAYGLRTDFRLQLFEASKRLIELADKLVELKSVCSCGRAARHNIRLINGEPTFEGQQMQIGAEETYTTICSECHYKLLKELKNGGTK